MVLTAPVGRQGADGRRGDADVAERPLACEGPPYQCMGGLELQPRGCGSHAAARPQGGCRAIVIVAVQVIMSEMVLLGVVEEVSGFSFMWLDIRQLSMKLIVLFSVSLA